MKCVSIDHFIDCEWEEYETLHLVVENPILMGDIVSELYVMSLGGEGSFCLSEDNKEIPFGKMIEIIINPFGIDFNSRQIVSKLYSELVKAEEPFVLEKAEINARILDYLEKITSELAYNEISFDINLDTVKLLKMYDVKANPEYLSLTEKLAEFIKILSLLLKKKVLILVNIRSYLESDNINELKKMARYYKVSLVLIDNNEGTVFEDDVVYIIDKDSCIIKK